ncbi:MULTISPECIES: methylmalonyl Co-A mutase-associated GTPase MeaB [unclassified Bradyrhizobium]|uniref:methylmalonyl Co-A mutase-associated GTPase MeaB n=1 Tax=unclassified Bradyrhizobium TaxID=2631580 RepID=UPI001BAD7CAC|nr:MULTISPECIES: methylmalonyl Co-A mutase-associated GTPase MeaB [unclassified Bradyrhizobium]MBR1202994.1 methylmalonyl Co-A mutase-associated GTPase MeaB [Bradyrhizobium sp. AUGA SZCCT0124]MBR1314409.1 methylmalonyl Co-A mutase-associated GTPase MeaB [Bradyrhizobium sp. AUGA SZCCT0051]MBR1342573.1 methylmalonyl Co-A mutase-associated GTPase MeaB [Bradyrhizobium sp. AUGA SZCCT0105]MBR1352803.1 methylmalonyl Co-A mutase-associated GTPase MeaB [Bradyrhizobium sp. AUGA SZCCT0045]
MAAASGKPDGHLDRRALGRSLSRIANASVEEALAGMRETAGGASRIGITGPPGAGKSTLIGRLARRRLDDGAAVAVVAIDPTSPHTHGAILGDRIRMDSVADDPRLFIRSLASRGANDGLADNIADVLATLDGYPFDEVILETVGVGQAEYAVRALVDTLVLVLIPESGDQVQAMKAGTLEMADIYVINKADLAGAERIASEIRAVARLRRRLASDWEPPVIMTAAESPDGITALNDAVSHHLDFLRASRNADEVRRLRREYHVKSLIMRTVADILAESPEAIDRSPREAFERVVGRLKERRR